MLHPLINPHNFTLDSTEVSMYHIHMSRNSNKIPTSKLKVPNRIKLRIAPFKILSLLLYGAYPWLQLTTSGTLRFNLTKFAYATHCNRARLREHLDWLVERGYLLQLNIQRGEAEVRLATPRNLVHTALNEREHTLAILEQKEALESILSALEAK